LRNEIGRTLRDATKDDLANFVTKEDSANFATKDDLANFITKEDSANFATKGDISRLMGIISDVMGEIQAMREDLALGTFRRSENSNMIENHEERIVNIEGHLNLAV